MNHIHIKSTAGSRWPARDLRLGQDQDCTVDDDARTTLPLRVRHSALGGRCATDAVAVYTLPAGFLVSISAPALACTCTDDTSCSICSNNNILVCESNGFFGTAANCDVSAHSSCGYLGGLYADGHLPRCRRVRNAFTGMGHRSASN